MHFLLDVDRRRVDDEIAPVLLILATPYELRIEVAVPTLVGDANRRLLRRIDERLVLRGRDVRACVFEVGQRLDGLRGRSTPSHSYTALPAGCVASVSIV